MSTLKVSNIVPKDGETMNLGESGSDTVVPVGSTITNNGTAIGFDVSTPGNVLQVLQATKSDTTSTNSNTFVSTGLEATITPINSSSKILVTVVFSYGAGADANSLFQLHRDSTAIHLGDAAGNRIRTSIGTSYQNTGTSGLENGTINALDTPATASPITYKLMFAKGNTGTSGPVYLNMSAQDADDDLNKRTISSITLMEVAG